MHGDPKRSGRNGSLLEVPEVRPFNFQVNMTTITLRLNDTDERMSWTADTFALAVLVMLTELKEVYGWTKPEDFHDIFEALTSLCDPFGENFCKSYDRFDFSTPEDNFTVSVEEWEKTLDKASV